MTQEKYIETINLNRHYRRGPQTIRAIDNVSVSFARGKFYGIVGASGSGKSTLLNLIAGLDSPDSGTIIVNGKELGSLSRKELSRYRADEIGIIFQSFNLISHYNALENVSAGLMFQNCPKLERREKGNEILNRLGIGDRLDHHPADLSGGEQQRVAIARALVKNPNILLADEPTGNLDKQNSEQIINLLESLNKDGLTVIMVTHDLDLAERFSDTIIRMNYGRVDDIYQPGASL